jgi:hypothetical protein
LCSHRVWGAGGTMSTSRTLQIQWYSCVFHSIWGAGGTMNTSRTLQMQWYYCVLHRIWGAVGTMTSAAQVCDSRGKISLFADRLSITKRGWKKSLRIGCVQVADSRG